MRKVTFAWIILFTVFADSPSGIMSTATVHQNERNLRTNALSQTMHDNRATELNNSGKPLTVIPALFQPQPAPLSDRLFEIRSLGNRCVDIGGQQWWAVNAPVSIFRCNGSLAQQIRVVEIDSTHDVTLRTATLSHCLGVSVPQGSNIRLGFPLELQTCNGSPVQRFALDGDSIMVGNQGQGQRVSREFVIETFNRSTQEKTRLVTAERDVSDAQYFRLFAADGSNARPTAGFVSVSTETELDRALTLGWGTVIEVTQSITLSRGRKTVPQGVTVRGYRKFTDNGPEIHYPVAALTLCDDENAVLHCAFVLQNNSRFTSLRLRGPHTTPAGAKAEGIFFRDDGQFTNVTVDRIDASDWNGSAIDVSGAFTDYGLECCSYSDAACVDHDPSTPAPPRFTNPRLTPVKLLGNIIHNNNGYGIVIGGGANPLVRGNLFFHNVHSLTADGHGANGYVAHDNLVTRWVIPGRPWTSNQFFDVHGTANRNHWMGGRAGDIFDVAWNTFLSHDHRNFGQRGTPCRHTLYRNNVSVQGPAAVETHSDPPTTLIKSGNKFNASDPLNKLGVGDFDGDGLSDIFLATAATWWYSSGGRSEWRFLNRMPELIDTLRFGDFDGDRRTDVVSLDATGKIRISWAGASPWITTLPTGQTLDSIAVGNFDGDHRDDVFVANGFTWSFAAGGTEFKFIGQSRLRPRDLRFGDFNKDGKTDIFFVSGTNWQLVKGGGSGTPEHWRTALTPNVQGLVVADFDGDGHADIARDMSGQWRYSTRGLGGFVNLRNAPSGQKIADRYVGHFDGDRKADVIVWDSVWFAIAPGSDNPVTRISWQGMR